MEAFNAIGVVLGSSWASGVNLYLTIVGLGISQRFGWIDLPGNLQVISHLLVIIIAIVLYVIEFVADKIPFVDTFGGAKPCLSRQGKSAASSIPSLRSGLLEEPLAKSRGNPKANLGLQPGVSRRVDSAWDCVYTFVVPSKGARYAC